MSPDLIVTFFFITVGFFIIAAINVVTIVGYYKTSKIPKKKEVYNHCFFNIFRKDEVSYLADKDESTQKFIKVISFLLKSLLLLFIVVILLILVIVILAIFVM